MTFAVLHILDVDECALNPCKNGATCVDLVNDYNCSCFGSWKGKNCDWITGEVMFACLLERTMMKFQTKVVLGLNCCIKKALVHPILYIDC